MTESLSLVLVFLAALSARAADRHASGVRRGAALRPARVVAGRGFALAALGLATWLWYRVEPGPAAFLAVLVAAMVSASACALLGPIAPRLLHAGAWLCLPLALALLALGAVP